MQKFFSSLLLLFSLFTSVTAPALAADSSENKVKVRPVEPFFNQSATSQEYQNHSTYLSPLKKAPIRFSSLGAHWYQTTPAGTGVVFEIRFKTERGLTDWYTLHAEIDTKHPSQTSETNRNSNNPSSVDNTRSEDYQVDPFHPTASNLPQQATAFISTNHSTEFQYRITLLTENKEISPVFEDLHFTFIRGGTPKQKTDLAINSFRQLSKASTIFEQHLDIPDNLDSDKILARKNDSPVKNVQQVAFDNPLMPADVQEQIRRRRQQFSERYQEQKTTTPLATSNQPEPLTTGLPIIRRTSWGADEGLRVFDPETAPEAQLVAVEDDYYTKFANELKVAKKVSRNQNGEQLTWPMTYPEKVEKIIIHHTATTKNLDDPARAIRDIYYWHTMTKGWGDIGYNFIIDPSGKIYEGRYGGDGVVAAHAGRVNHGSIGIAVLGNYQDKEPPAAVIDSLTKLITEKSIQHGINPTGSSTFRGVLTPNIIGHRDVGATSCPGEKLYQKMGSIRRAAKTAFDQAEPGHLVKSSDYSFEFNSTPSGINIGTNSKQTITLDFKNTGTKTWDAGSSFVIAPSPYLFNSSLQSSTLKQAVRPGQSAKVTFEIKTQNLGGSDILEIALISADGKPQNGLVYLPLTVNAPEPQKAYDYAVFRYFIQNIYQPGEQIDAIIKLKNTGTQTWFNSGNHTVNLGTDLPRDRQSQLLPAGGTRYASLQEQSVPPGEIGTFIVKLTVPTTPGTYKEHFTPVVEGKTWMENRNTFFEIRVGERSTGNSGSSSTNPAKISDSFALPKNNTSSTTTSPPSGGSSINISPTPLNTNLAAQDIRIDLAYRGNPVQISSSGQFSLIEGRSWKHTYSPNTIVTVEHQDDQFKITGGGKTFQTTANPHFKPLAGAIMRIDNWERRNSWGERANNNEFRGSLEILIYDNELHVINQLPLEDYLKGIAEVGPDQPTEKIKTIMILARTYARFYMEVAEKFPGAPFHLNDDPNYSQKYLGYSFEKRSPKTAQLAAQTAGQVVTYNGRLIKTPYFSRSNGKTTISARQKWGWTDAPWLPSVDDSHCDSTEFWGHGVGLSGCGATAFANQGKNYQEIIKHYYPGVSITKTKY